MSKLWAIHIPGPDDLHAAPSEAAAHHMAAKNNAAMTEYLEKHPELVEPPFGLLRESVMTTVVEWDGTAESHANWLKGFDYAGWGLEAPAATHSKGKA
jgi:hypothetical protein